MGGCAVYCLLAARNSAGGHGHGAAVGEGQATQALDADDLKQRLTRLKALQAATSA